MVGKFLNLDDETPTIGQGLKTKKKGVSRPIDKDAIAETGKAHGFDRTTSTATTKHGSIEQPRRGRPPLNDEMVYWRIYVSPSLRAELNKVRDQEGRRLNDVLEDMLAAYRVQSGER